MGRLLEALLLVLPVACARPSSTTSTTTTSATREEPRAFAWGDRIDVASGEAVRGEWKQNDSIYRWVDDPAVTFAPGGDVVVAWADQAKKDIFVRRYAPDGSARTAAAVNVSQSPTTFSWLPRVLADARGFALLWQEIVFSGGTHGGEIFFVREGAAPINLSNSVAGDGKGRLDEKTWDNGSLDLARGPHGELYAAWTEYEGTLWLRRSDDGGVTFKPAVRVGGSRELPARGPSLAVADDGTVHVAWTVGEDPHAALRVASSSDRGWTFGAARIIGGGAAHRDYPSLAVDRQGDLHLVYAESAEGRGGAYHVRHARTRAGGDFHDTKRIAPDGTTRPVIALDGRGRIFALWERRTASQSRGDGLVIAMSNDGGATFTASAVPAISAPALGGNGSQQGMLLEKLAVAPSGDVALANSTFLPDRESHVWLLRGSPR